MKIILNFYSSIASQNTNTDIYNTINYEILLILSPIIILFYTYTYTIPRF